MGKNTGLGQEDYETQFTIPACWFAVLRLESALFGKGPMWIVGYLGSLRRPQTFYNRPLLMLSKCSNS